MRKGIYQLSHTLTIYFTDKRGKRHVLEIKKNGETFYGESKCGFGRWDDATTFGKILNGQTTWPLHTDARRNLFICSERAWHKYDIKLDNVELGCFDGEVKIPIAGFQSATAVTLSIEKNELSFNEVKDRLTARDFVWWLKDNNLFLKGE